MRWRIPTSTSNCTRRPTQSWLRRRSRDTSERVYQVFGKDVLDQLIPVAAMQPLAHVGLPQPPPWRRQEEEEDQSPVEPGEMRVHGFVSKPEIQKLNRNSIYVFVNGRLIRDRLIQHALTEAYRNILPPTVYPVVLLFLELPSGEVDVNVHPSKTEVRFRQQSVMHDFVRDSVRAALMKARPVPQFMTEINAHPTASSVARLPELVLVRGILRVAHAVCSGRTQAFALQAPVPPPVTERFHFGVDGIAVDGNAALSLVRAPQVVSEVIENDSCAPPAARGTRDWLRFCEQSRAVAGVAQAAGTDSRIVHPRGESRGPVDRGPARRPRARAV